jgi:hypothetical protein
MNIFTNNKEIMERPTKRARIKPTGDEFMESGSVEKAIPVEEISSVVKLGLLIFVYYLKGIHTYLVVYLLSLVSPEYTLDDTIRKKCIALCKNHKRLAYTGLIGKFYSVLFLDPTKSLDTMERIQTARYENMRNALTILNIKRDAPKYKSQFSQLCLDDLNKRIRKLIRHISANVKYRVSDRYHIRILRNMINALNSGSWKGAFRPYSNDLVLSYLYYSTVFNCMLYAKNLKYITTAMGLFPARIRCKQYERFDIDNGSRWSVNEGIMMLSRVSSKEIYSYVRLFLAVSPTRYTKSPGINELSTIKILNELYTRWNGDLVFGDTVYDRWLAEYAIPKIRASTINTDRSFQGFVHKSENHFKAREMGCKVFMNAPFWSRYITHSIQKALLTQSNARYIAKTCRAADIILIAQHTKDTIGFGILWECLAPEQRNFLYDNPIVRKTLNLVYFGPKKSVFYRSSVHWAYSHWESVYWGSSRGYSISI